MLAEAEAVLSGEWIMLQWKTVHLPVFPQHKLAFSDLKINKDTVVSVGEKKWVWGRYEYDQNTLYETPKKSISNIALK